MMEGNTPEATSSQEINNIQAKTKHRSSNKRINPIIKRYDVGVSTKGLNKQLKIHERAHKKLTFKCYERTGGSLILKRLSKVIKASKKAAPKLIIQVSNNNNVTFKALNQLFESLKRLAYIESFNFCLKFCQGLDDSMVYGLCGVLKRLDSLKSLNLILNPCSAKINDKVFKSLGQVLKGLICLQSLDLTFEWGFNISDQALWNLSRGLSKLSSLRSLGLTFFQCDKITNKAFENLNKGLQGLISLRNLNLSFSSCFNLGDQAFGMLGEGLTELTCLESLIMNFSGCDGLSDKAFGELSKGLLKNEQQILAWKNLDLSFMQCLNLKEEAFYDLSQILKALNSLQKLSLNFGMYLFEE